MVRISSILVIVDPTASEHPAIDKAAHIARKCNARLELFACETRESRVMRYAAHLAKAGKSDNEEFIVNLRAVLESLARPIRKLGVDVCIEVDAADPLHVALLERTRHTSADLVVKDTHHHSFAKRTFITNTDWHLIRGCPVPLLLTKATPWRDAPLIAAAVDPGHANDKPAVLDQCILDWAQLLAKRLGSPLHALHAYLPVALVVEAASGMPAVMSSLTPQILAQEREMKQAQLEALTRPYDIPAASLHLQLGAASYALPQLATDIGADIVAMGAIARSGLQKVFIGSTAERVLEQLPSDVLVIKPANFAASLPF